MTIGSSWHDVALWAAIATGAFLFGLLIAVPFRSYASPWTRTGFWFEAAVLGLVPLLRGPVPTVALPPLLLRNVLLVTVPIVLGGEIARRRERRRHERLASSQHQPTATS